MPLHGPNELGTVVAALEGEALLVVSANDAHHIGDRGVEFPHVRAGQELAQRDATIRADVEPFAGGAVAQNACELLGQAVVACAGR